MRYLTAWFGFWVIFWLHLIIGAWLIFKRMEEWKRGERDEREYMRLVRLDARIQEAWNAWTILLSSTRAPETASR